MSHGINCCKTVQITASVREHIRLTASLPLYNFTNQNELNLSPVDKAFVFVFLFFCSFYSILSICIYLSLSAAFDILRVLEGKVSGGKLNGIYHQIPAGLSECQCDIIFRSCWRCHSRHILCLSNTSDQSPSANCINLCFQLFIQFWLESFGKELLNYVWLGTMEF